MENKEYPEALFKKYLNGRCSPEELKTLLQYFEVPENKILLKKLIHEQLGNDDDNLYKLSSVQTAVNDVYELIRLEIQKEKENAEEVKTVKLRRWKLGAVAVWLLPVIASGIMIYFWNKTSQPQVRYQKLVTQRGERAKIKLPDGTGIWLSPSSTLEYPEKFDREVRKINLTGEAFFDVAKDKVRPFIIHSGPLTTKVLGTSFNIKSYGKEQPFSVTVLTGKVEVNTSGTSDKPAMKVELCRNQRAVFDSKKQVLVKENDLQASRLLSEREGSFEFNGVSVSGVLEEVRRQYSVDIRTEGDISRCKFYGALHAAENITVFLKKLCLVINARWRLESGTYVIVAGGC